MIIYKLKHIPTGLFFRACKQNYYGTNLVEEDNGDLYFRGKPRLQKRGVLLEDGHWPARNGKSPRKKYKRLHTLREEWEIVEYTIVKNS